MIAVVGSRSCSVREEQSAERLGETLATHGFVVVSGLARGIDTAAITGAVRRGGRVVAVLPTAKGEDVYPRANRGLVHQLTMIGGIALTPFSQPCQDGYGLRRRLIERNFLMALHCSLGIVVSDDHHITGGTAWMVAFCQELNRPLGRLTSSGVLHLSLPQVQRKVWWAPELDALRQHITRVSVP